MNRNRIILAFALVLIGGAILYFESLKPQRAGNNEGATIPIAFHELASNATSAGRSLEETPNPAEGATGAPHGRVLSIAEKQKEYRPAKEIVHPSGFVNAKQISIGERVGKEVILVDFWTYSCINCQRTTPYLNAWWQKYKDKGLVIVGIHTPEFAFEKKYENVLAAVKKFGIEYPVVLDNDYATWSAYNNRFWPRKYLIDIDGFIVYDHIGEGGYVETEQKIQEALRERMDRLGTPVALNGGAVDPQDAPSVDVSRVGSPEVYFGAGRNSLFKNGVPGRVGSQSLALPSQAAPNALYLAGDWNFETEYAENKSAGAKIIFRYRAKTVHFVASAESGTRIRILKDNKPLGASAGIDVSETDSSAFIKEDRLYTLIEDAAYGEHTIEITIESPGLRAFTFTFG